MQREVAKGLEAQAAQRLNVFISYARADLARAQEIVKALEARNLTCTIDTRDLPYGEKWQNELRDFIRAADTVVFLVSLASVRSRWCKWELAQVTAQSKRLVPVLLERVAHNELPPEISEVHLLPLTREQPFEDGVDALARALLTDRTWIKEHTRLADRASKWLASGRSKDHLLSGNALLEADQWMARRPASAPPPSQEQLDFIVASHVAAKRRGRMWLGGLAALVVVFAGVAGVALWQRQEAVDQRARAIEERDGALIAQSRLLAKASQDSLGTGSTSKATLLALEALPGKGPGEERPYVIDAERALRASLVTPQEIFRVSAKPGPSDVPPTDDMVAIGDNDIFLAQERDVLRYTLSSRSLARIPLEDRPVAIHLTDSNRLLVGTDTGCVLSLARADAAPATLATVGHDIAGIATSPDGAFVLVAGEQGWSLLDGATGRIVKQGEGSDAKIGEAGKVLYSVDGRGPASNAANPREIWIFEPASQKDAVLLASSDDLDIVNFAIDKSGNILVVLSSRKLVTLDLTTGKKSILDLPILSTFWQNMILAESGSVALICAYRSPICVLYDFELDEGLPLYHPKNADPVAFGASDLEFMTLTWDGRLYSWTELSRGSHDYVLSQPEFKLELLGDRLIRARVLADAETLVTVAWREPEMVVQGWKRRITPMRSAEPKLPEAFNLRGQAEDANLWFLPKSSSDGAYLYDFDRDEALTIPFADGVQTARRLCAHARLMLVSGKAGFELWDISDQTAKGMAFPEAVRALLSDKDRPADLICNQKTLAVAAGNKVILWRIDDGVVVSAAFGGKIKAVRSLEANGELMVIESDRVHVIDARGQVRVSAKRELFSRDGVSYQLGAACAFKDKGALLMANEDGDGIAYRFALEGKSISFLAESRFEPFQLYRSVFDRPCRLLAYHRFRSGKAGVVDLDKGEPIVQFDLEEAEYWGIDFDDKERGLLLFGVSGQIYLVNFDADFARTTDAARRSVVSCLSPPERASLLLTPEPPNWCITGPGRETEDDPGRWLPKPPYDSAAWKDWLVAARTARDKGAEPPPVPEASKR